MPLPVPLLSTDFPSLRLLQRGKVRDVYEIGDELIIVATDRISAFDYVLGSGIPDKGKVLTQLSAFWLDALRDVVPNHMLSVDPREYPLAARPYADELAGRSMLVRRTRPLPIECVARGYLSGSGWKDYLATGQVCGLTLPTGLRESDRFASPLFTPATKATSGHDINISEGDASALVGPERLAEAKHATLELYRRGAAHAETAGIILADTKFEFGLIGASDSPSLMLIDEVLTPDSSRFWPADRYQPGGPQASFDKQFVRDYLESIRWNKQPPVPTLPDEVVARTREKYVEAFRRLTGRDLR